MEICGENQDVFKMLWKCVEKTKMSLKCNGNLWRKPRCLLNVMEICGENQDVFKMGQNCVAFTMKT
jgi:hypothetical protein